MKTEGYLLEFQSMGPVTKVLATDVQSGVEITYVGSAESSQSELTNLALERLKETVEQERAALNPER